MHTSTTRPGWLGRLKSLGRTPAKERPKTESTRTEATGSDAGLPTDTFLSPKKNASVEQNGSSPTRSLTPDLGGEPQTPSPTTPSMQQMVDSAVEPLTGNPVTVGPHGLLTLELEPSPMVKRHIEIHGPEESRRKLIKAAIEGARQGASVPVPRRD